MKRKRPYFHGALCAACLTGTFHVCAQQISTNSAPSSSVASAKINDIVTKMMQEAYHDLDDGNLESALQGADGAILLDPRNQAVYQLRGAIYIQKKLWDRAEQDYNTALSLAPDTPVAKFKLAEIKFLQKSYDEARPRYGAVVDDPALGDLALYKIFLCDLLGRHQDRAGKELTVFNQPQAATNPSHFYANAAWALVHNKFKEANTWVSLAQEIFDTSKTDLYLSPLVNANDLHSAVVSFTAKSGVQFYKVRAFLESDGLRVSSTRGWITVPYDQLPDDLSAFPTDLRKKITQKREVAPDINGSGLVTFTTKPGKTFKDVRVTLVDDGLQMIGPDGWIVIPFDQLPDDLGSFPPDLREQIKAKGKSTTDSGKTSDIVTFTTKAGKTYDHLRASLQADGVQVLTEDGWITVPVDQLPTDLSPFPPDMRDKIAAQRHTPVTVDNADPGTVSFTTKAGKKYEHVRASVVTDGLQLLTEDGWITVPFDQLPNDLAKFPPALRDEIAGKRQDAADNANAGTNLVTFTTKNGKTYADVRVSLGSDGLEVLTPEGLVIIPFDQLKDDLTSFPVHLRRQIEAKRHVAAPSRNDSQWATFDTTRGKHYDQVRVFIANEGLSVLSPQGWIIIPYDQLPKDLSPFPAGLRPQIAAKQAEPPVPSKTRSAPITAPYSSHHGKAVVGDSDDSMSPASGTDPSEGVPASPTPKD